MKITKLRRPTNAERKRWRGCKYVSPDGRYAVTGWREAPGLTGFWYRVWDGDKLIAKFSLLETARRFVLAELRVDEPNKPADHRGMADTTTAPDTIELPDTFSVEGLPEVFDPEDVYPLTIEFFTELASGIATVSDVGHTVTLAHMESSTNLIFRHIGGGRWEMDL